MPLPFPFYVKPVKAAFSVLARRVDSYADLERHARFSWFEQAIIERLVKPFGDAMRARPDFTVEPFSMLAEEVIDGRQVTVNGFARRGSVTMLGVVDSIMYPGTDQFQRFQYPSALPAEWQSRAEDAARRALAAVGFTHGMFNVELRVCAATGHAKLIEINPRAAGQFYDLFERVDGYSLFDALLALETGEEPQVRHRMGPDAVAGSFVMRDLEGAGLGRWPGRGEIARLRTRHPGARIMVYPKRGRGPATRDQVARQLSLRGREPRRVVARGTLRRLSAASIATSTSIRAGAASRRWRPCPGRRPGLGGGDLPDRVRPPSRAARRRRSADWCAR